MQVLLTESFCQVGSSAIGNGLILMLQVQKFYTAPTLIRSLMREGDDHVTGSDTSSLQVLGTVGEPINPEAWKWYHKVCI